MSNTVTAATKKLADENRLFTLLKLAGSECDYRKSRELWDFRLSLLVFPVCFGVYLPIHFHVIQRIDNFQCSRVQ